MTNEVLESLLSRRSCRAYTEQKPTDEELETIMNAGLYAPTGKNMQTPIFVCVKNKSIRDELSKLNAQVMKSDADPFYGAPVVIAVLSDTTSPMYVQDASLAMQNLMLAAHSIGLATCWINRGFEVFRTEEGKKLKKEWNIPDSFEGVAFCIVGHAKNDLPKPAPRRQNRIITVE